MREFKLIEEKYGTYAEFYKYIDGKRKVKRLITPSELIVVKDILARKDNDALENFIYSHLPIDMVGLWVYTMAQKQKLLRRDQRNDHLCRQCGNH